MTLSMRHQRPTALGIRLLLALISLSGCSTDISTSKGGGIVSNGLETLSSPECGFEYQFESNQFFVKHFEFGEFIFEHFSTNTYFEAECAPFSRTFSNLADLRIHLAKHQKYKHLTFVENLLFPNSLSSLPLPIDDFDGIGSFTFTLSPEGHASLLTSNTDDLAELILTGALDTVISTFHYLSTHSF